MLLVSEMSRRLSRFWEVQCSVLVPSQYGVPNVQNETLNPFIPVIWSPHAELPIGAPSEASTEQELCDGYWSSPVLLARI
jgi:hypothetical protein